MERLIAGFTAINHDSMSRQRTRDEGEYDDNGPTTDVTTFDDLETHPRLLEGISDKAEPALG